MGQTFQIVAGMSKMAIFEYFPTLFTCPNIDKNIVEPADMRGQELNRWRNRLPEVFNEVPVDPGTY